VRGRSRQTDGVKRGREGGRAGKKRKGGWYVGFKDE